MKAFRGTLIAALLLALVALAVHFLEPPSPEEAVQESPPLLRFEKQDLVRVEIQRPDRTLVLAEQPDGRWLVEGPGWEASTSMVNRVKHQLHDLDARATVVDAPESPELYGLGRNATRVTLTLRDGSTLSFLAGDPNPSSVSYYIQPLPGERVYTVKKSALDYFSLSPEDFREHRFVRLDSADADRLEAWLPGGRHLLFQREGPYAWRMEDPLQVPASRDAVRRLLGRVAALKAVDFAEDHPEDLSRYGLDRPRARILVSFASRDPLDLRIGKRADWEEPGRRRTFAYMLVEGVPTVYVAPDGLLDDFLEDPQGFRLMRFMRMQVGEVVELALEMRPTPEDEGGRVLYRYRADHWLWEDGTPVPGSTPSRLASRAAQVEADAIVAERVGDPRRWGFDEPLLSLRLVARDGTSRSLLVGDEAEPRVDEEGRSWKRYYARADDQPTVYRIDEAVVQVARDALREARRKARRDAERAERRQRIEEALEGEAGSGEGGAPGGGTAPAEEPAP